MKRNRIVLLLSILVVISSCSKKEDTPTTPTNTFNPAVKIDFLTAGNWKLTGYSVSPGVDRNGKIVTDLMPDISGWNKDNTRLFGTNGTGIEDEGPTKMSQTDLQIIPLLWSFNSDQTKFTLSILRTNKTYTYIYDLLQLDASTLKYSLPQDWTSVGGKPGTNYIITFTYSH
jgi:hypothetical protein